MFARSIHMKLKPKSALTFSRLYNRQVLPVLREQPGFKDGMTLISGERAEAIVLSFWDRRSSADAFAKSAYAGLIADLDGVLASPPQVSTMVLSNSTKHQLATRG